MKSIISGFKFGMMLQFAIGPITLLIFQIAVASGFGSGFAGMVGAAAADAIFVAAAILGLGAVLNRNEAMQKYMKIFGAVVMVLFGVLMILGSLGIELVPNLNLVDGDAYDSVLVKVFVLTLANPMTVLFWTGVFAAKIAEDEMHIRDLWFFGLGAVLTTVVFQTLVAALGSSIKVFLGTAVLTALNVLVGVMLVLFGIRLLDRKKNLAVSD